MTGYARPIDRIRDERKSTAQARRRRLRLIRIGTGVVAGLLAIGLGLVVVFSDDTDSSIVPPGVGDHWHATYSVVIDGEELPAFPASEGDTHSHGDGLIHIHPHSASTANHAANLGAFFASVGGELTNDTLRLPDGRTFGAKGDASELRILVNDDAITEWAAFVPQNDDRIEIVVTGGGG